MWQSQICVSYGELFRLSKRDYKKRRWLFWKVGALRKTAGRKRGLKNE